MNYSQFNQLNEEIDQKIIMLNQHSYSISCEYDEIARIMVKRCEENIFEHTTIFPLCDGSCCKLLESTAIFIDKKNDELYVKLKEGDPIPFSTLMVDSKEMFINYLQIHVKTDAIYNNFFRADQLT
ncbi:MAG: hypothetical protein PF637_08075 [Spirochaetes bacterium]|jgi:hypothetical protein|nr:hypothetical protein [Spirochaetota bacterium]